jgi:DNA-directed RNA polymerase specialized sigma subunit, sigma24 homolog
MRTRIVRLDGACAYYYDRYFFDEEVKPQTSLILSAVYDALTPRQLQAIVLRYLRGFTLAEAALEMTCGKSTVARLAESGLLAMRQGLCDAGIESYAALTRKLLKYSN